MKIKYYAFIALLLFVVSLSESAAKQPIKKDSIKINSFILKYELYEFSLNLILIDTIHNTRIENKINDFNGILDMSDELHDFDVIKQPNGFILKYIEQYIGYSYATSFHVFKQYNNQFYYSKVYYAADGRNSSLLTGNIVAPKIIFQEYAPKDDINGGSLLEYHVGYQDYEEEHYEEPEPILPNYEKKISKFSALKQKDSLKVYCDYFILDRWLSQSYGIPENKVSINNIAYYLGKGSLYHESIYILEKLLQHYPNRTVAYINLGDAYWGVEDKEKASQAYKKYIELMKSNGKEHKIPNRIWDKMKND
ncbi:tetratricopeptide repeat protein [Marinilabiliaceae bacterium JC017]|nr:tetratricopeptide repeat protein [Marinilabiliaceae bacterium JC017]